MISRGVDSRFVRGVDLRVISHEAAGAHEAAGLHEAPRERTEPRGRDFARGKREVERGLDMVLRVYVEKKPGFDVEAQQLLAQLRDFVGIKALRGLRVVNRYDVEGISEELFDRCVTCVFSEPQSDNATRELPDVGTAHVFAVEYLPGQFDQRADSASECIQLISQGERPRVRSAKLYYLLDAQSAACSNESAGKDASEDADENASTGGSAGENGDAHTADVLTQADIEAIKHYVINPIEAREASLDECQTLTTDYPEPADVEILEDFLELTDEQLSDFIAQRGLAMDEADIAFCQRYFADVGRAPTITEIKMIDTYWSDHCRHTTFNTELDNVEIEDANVQAAFDTYLSIRRELGRDEKPLCLMDMSATASRYLKANGKLSDLDESEEINACTVHCKVDVDGQDQDWLYLFKNETHNHPTEIEPFGGAATCIGGAIRDPLAGRGYVYQAMRLTGAADPRVPVEDTLPGKLPQRKIVTTAADGYSSYGNQIGLATGQVHELYHPGYAAKRMEIGVVVGATPADHVHRQRPVPGDVVVLLGGRTGRDGIGGATGSSKAHSKDSLENCGAEVQKGNAPEERKIQRLFRRKETCRMIKRCNDFGAGGVSVAVGELADSLLIDLDSVPKKYDGLDGTELAISESQERMAVVLSADDTEAFLALAHEENLEATQIATVTDSGRVQMTWRGKTIVDISRDFLASNGAPKHQAVKVSAPVGYARTWEGETLGERLHALVSDINVASNKGLSERFDSTIGAATVLMPFGGRYQLTPAQAMVAKLPVFGETTTVSGMAWGFNPYLSEADPFVGSYIAVVESIAKLVAAGFERKNAYLTFQEYFERLREEPTRWGKPMAAVLGALAAELDLEVASIGGKDSMSGSFEDLDVPPTLVSFATALGSVDRIVSPEFKGDGHRVVRIEASYGGNFADGRDSGQGFAGRLMPDAQGEAAVLTVVEELIACGGVLAASTPGYGGTAEALFKMCVGNRFGITCWDNINVDDLFAPVYGSLIVELAEGEDVDALIEELVAQGRISPEQREAVHVVPVGFTTRDYEFSCEGETVDLADVQESWESAMEGIFPYRSSAREREGGDGGVEGNEDSEGTGDGGSTGDEDNDAAADSDEDDIDSNDIDDNEDGTADNGDNGTGGSGGTGDEGDEDVMAFVRFPYIIPNIVHHLGARPRVVIPVFPGSNCEYDTARAFERAGAVVDTFVINNLTPDAVVQSTAELVRLINNAQIIMLPGGFSGGDEPDGSAKFITAFFRAPQVTEAVRDLLQNRDGLMLGICNGFQALVKLGLVPFGDIIPMGERYPTLTYNKIGRHQSKLVRTRVASTLSPWFSGMTLGEIHTVAISHGEGRFVAPRPVLDQLEENGQIATQYVDAEGMPSMDLSANPNGSVWAIESITSPDGRVLGRMGHSERNGAGLYKNVPGDFGTSIFEAGVNYFG